MLLFLTATDHNQFLPEFRTCGYCKIETLVIGKAGDTQVEIIGLHHRIRIHADSRVNGHRIAMIVLPDPFVDEIGVASEEIHSLGRKIIPLTHLVDHPWHAQTGQQARMPAVLVVHVPDIAGRGMAIADMGRRHRGKHALGATGTGGNHHVIPGQVQRLESLGHERQIFLVPLGGTGELLHIGRDDMVVLETFRHMLSVIDQREHRCLGPDCQPILDDPLSPSVRRQPIMHNRDFHAIPQ